MGGEIVRSETPQMSAVCPTVPPAIWSRGGRQTHPTANDPVRRPQDVAAAVPGGGGPPARSRTIAAAARPLRARATVGERREPLGCAAPAVHPASVAGRLPQILTHPFATLAIAGVTRYFLYQPIQVQVNKRTSDVGVARIKGTRNSKKKQPQISDDVRPQFPTRLFHDGCRNSVVGWPQPWIPRVPC